MRDVLETKAPSGTYTIQRCRDNTETPKQVVDAREPDESKCSARNVAAYEAGVLTFVSGARQYTSAPSDVEASLLASPQDQADALLEAGGTDLSGRLNQVIAAMQLDTPVAVSLIAEIVERLWRCGVSSAGERRVRSRLAEVEQRYKCFRSRLIATLLDEPIEDGVRHPAEHVIDDALGANSSDCRDWLSRVLVEQYQTRPSISASIVRCIGRLEYDQVGAWGMRVADDALRHKDVEVREAAIRALEAWGGRKALDILRNYEDERPWLNEYVRQVIVDLSGTAS